MITESITEHAVAVLDSTGYFGAFFLMMLESMIFPVPSEAVMPFVGFLVVDGKMNLVLAVMATSLGSIVGSLLSYAMGYYGGRPLVLKLGKYLLLNPDDLTNAENFFHRRHGTITVFVGRFIPIIRHLISIPAGAGRMPMTPFILSTLAGATLWNSFLLWLGMTLRDNWQAVLRYSHVIDILIILLAAVLLVIFLYKRKQRYLETGGRP
ncbi:MAG: DedA family protein [Gammaproteobacteria bacterium]